MESRSGNHKRHQAAAARRVQMAGLFTDAGLRFQKASKGQINNKTDKVEAAKEIWAFVVVLFVLPRQFIKSKSA